MSNSTVSFALVTPSFKGDFERCELLVRSVEKFVPPEIRHYIVVPKADLALFRTLSGPRTTIVAEPLPRWIINVRLFNKWRISLQSPPLRGWIIQQLVKLSTNSIVDDDVFIFVDSDIFFVKPFDPKTYVKNGQVPMFREANPVFLDQPRHLAWHKTAQKLIGPSLRQDYSRSYVGSVIYWVRDHLQLLQERMSDHCRTDWKKAVCRNATVSEYNIYGLFVEDVLGSQSRHYFDDTIYCTCYWDERPLTEEGLDRFKASIGPHQYAAMVSAKSGTPMALIQKTFEGDL